jgi:glycogen operon protein
VTSSAAPSRATTTPIARTKSESGRALTEFVARLIRLRRDHPVLSCQHFLLGEKEVAPGIQEIDWFDERGEHLSPQDWDNGEARAFSIRRASLRDDGKVEVASLLLNASHEPIDFHLAAPRSYPRQVILDSADPSAPERELAGDDVYTVQDRAAVLLLGLIDPKAASGPEPAGEPG